MSYPSFAAGDILNASDMNAVGLWLVKTQTVGTAVSSVTVTNAFNANYDAYKIIWSGGSMSVETNLLMSLGSTSTGYYLALIWGSYAGGAVSLANNNNSSVWSQCGGPGSANIDLINPFLTKATEMQARVRYSTVYGTSVGALADSNSYTSFTFTPASGTMTGGTIRVYGYRN